MELTKATNYNPVNSRIYELDGEGKVIGKTQPKFQAVLEEMPSDNDYQSRNAYMRAQGFEVADLSGRKSIEYYFASEEMINNAKDSDEAHLLKCIRAGLLYKKQCVNFSNARDFDKLTAEQDLTGMTDGEKYTAIYEKYQHCYGENFLQAFERQFTVPAAERDDYTQLELKWKKELKTEFGSIENAEKARREALYGKADEHTVRNDIIGKYAQNDKLTFRDLYDMTYEMSLCGVDHGMSDALDNIFETYGGYYMSQPGEHGQLLREQMLDDEVTADHFKYLLDVQSSKLHFGNPTDPQMGQVIGQIQSAFSGKLSSGGRTNTLSSLADRLSGMLSAPKMSSAAAVSAYKSTSAVTASDDPLATLRSRYDLDNMPMGSDEEKAFLNELVDMKLISEKDARLFNFNCGGSVESVTNDVMITPFDEWDGDITLWQEVKSKSDNILERLMDIIDTQRNISEYYREKISDIKRVRESDNSGLEASEAFLADKLRIADVLKSIME